MLPLLFSQTATAEEITYAEYLNPVNRYGHFALGRPHEYSALRITTNRNRSLGFELPENEVFEDLAPRLVRLSEDQAPKLLTIISNRKTGAKLALVEIKNGKIRISAESKPIGTPMRWLNPVGVADLDGDGTAEIAAVITPHIGGILKLYKVMQHQLAEQASLPGFSNHVYGSAELGLSTTVKLDGKNYLLVPDKTRRNLRIISYSDGKLKHVRKCGLSSPVSSNIRISGKTEARAHISSESKPINLKDCS